LSEQTFGAAQKCLISELGLRDLTLVPVVELELEPLALLEAEVDHELCLEGRVGVVVDLLSATWNSKKKIVKNNFKRSSDIVLLDLVRSISRTFCG